MEGLFDDQMEVVTVIMDKLIEWATCPDLKNFKPLRMTLNGPGGTGKTIVINTIVSLIRKMFPADGTVKVCAPTGVAAFNAGGQTLHHLLKNKAGMGSYDPHSMSASKRRTLTTRLSNLLCLIIDERSLLDSTLVGVSEQMVSETVFDGAMADKSWGAIPVVLLVGDDYQLPGVQGGAFDALTSLKGSKMTNNGRRVFRECCDCVMSLTTSKRIQNDREDDKRLMSKLRTATELSESEMGKLLNLHLNHIKERHGQQAVDEINKNSIYLYYRNNKRIMKNLEVLVENSSPESPVAICRTQSNGIHSGKAVKSHFSSSKIACSSLLAVGTKVALENRNFRPQWGLHNGAVGIVDEIIFTEGKNPNNGDLPTHVVVNFPHYIGPTWDINNTKVSNENNQ